MGDSARTVLGLIAEDIYKINDLKGIVEVDELGPRLIDYEKLAILLVPVVKSLKSKINDL